MQLLPCPPHLLASPLQELKLGQLRCQRLLPEESTFWQLQPLPHLLPLLPLPLHPRKLASSPARLLSIPARLLPSCALRLGLAC